jgi:hypothetical protein
LRSICVALLFAITTLSHAQVTSHTQKPLSEAQLQQVLKAGVDSQRLAKVVQERGVDFEVTGESLVGLREKGAEPILVRSLGVAALRVGRGPIDAIFIQELVAADFDNEMLARAVRERNVSFRPGADYLEGLESAGAKEILLDALRDVNQKPLTMDQVLELVANGVPNSRVAALVRLRRINRKPSVDDLDNLRIAGADDSVVQALREIKFDHGTIRVNTVLGASVFLDGAIKGMTGSEGQAVIDNVKPGTHSVRVLYEGREQTRSVSVPAGEVIDVKIPL